MCCGGAKKDVKLSSKTLNPFRISSKLFQDGRSQVCAFDRFEGDGSIQGRLLQDMSPIVNSAIGGKVSDIKGAVWNTVEGEILIADDRCVGQEEFNRATFDSTWLNYNMVFRLNHKASSRFGVMARGLTMMYDIDAEGKVGVEVHNESGKEFYSGPHDFLPAEIIIVTVTNYGITFSTGASSKTVYTDNLSTIVGFAMDNKTFLHSFSFLGGVLSGKSIALPIGEVVYNE